MLKEFGITLCNSAFSTVNSKRVTANKAAKKPSQPAANGAVARKKSSKTGRPTELALTIKELVAQHGPEAIKDMVDVFAK